LLLRKTPWSRLEWKPASTACSQAKLLYGTHTRLRVEDADFSQYHIVVRGTKGNEDRVTLLPEQLKPILQEHLQHVNALTNQISRPVLMLSTSCAGAQTAPHQQGVQPAVCFAGVKAQRRFPHGTDAPPLRIDSMPSPLR
jgi:site-specific recombinase XerD